MPYDITISYPGVHGLNLMWDICNQLACDNVITLNSKETVCITFCESVYDNAGVKLNDKILKWNTAVRHLGMFSISN